jgi:hypothetical protein
MGFFATVFGCGKSDGRFVSEKAFQKNLAQQVTMTPQTLTQLRKYNVTPQKSLKLEYFFYTDTNEKAVALAEVLKQKGYSVEYGQGAGKKGELVVTGWTSPMLMTDALVLKWTEDMCKVGFEHDCDFDGWGTNPNQD